jgi:hypothetical protein
LAPGTYDVEVAARTSGGELVRATPVRITIK